MALVPEGGKQSFAQARVIPAGSGAAFHPRG